MRNVFSRYLGRLMARSKKAFISKQDSARLRLLSDENRTCRLLSGALSNVTFGEYVAILESTVVDDAHIADFSYISNYSRINNVEIGKFCSIGSGVHIGLGMHPVRGFVSTSPVFYSPENPGCPLSFQSSKTFNDAAPRTVLGNDVWIGTSAIIPGGINIGTGAVVAAGAVVVKDVPPYAVVGGNPAQIIRYRFSEEHIKLLLESEWWNWPLKEFVRCVDDFSDIEKFEVRLTSAAQAKS